MATKKQFTEQEIQEMEEWLDVMDREFAYLQLKEERGDELTEEEKNQMVKFREYAGIVQEFRKLVEHNGYLIYKHSETEFEVCSMENEHLFYAFSMQQAKDRIECNFEEDEEYVKCNNQMAFDNFLLAYDWGQTVKEARAVWFRDTGIEFSEIQGKWFCQIKGRVYLKEDKK